jgi:hypothetical protein
MSTYYFHHSIDTTCESREEAQKSWNWYINPTNFESPIFFGIKGVIRENILHQLQRATYTARKMHDIIISGWISISWIYINRTSQTAIDIPPPARPLSCHFNLMSLFVYLRSPQHRYAFDRKGSGKCTLYRAKTRAAKSHLQKTPASY